MLEITLQRGGKPLLKEPIGAEPITIGRAPESRLQLLDPEISREHCRIEWRDGVLYARDLSRNGILVNNEPRRESEINAGDRIVIGPWTLVIETTIDAVPVRTIAASPHATHVLAYDHKRKRLTTERLELIVRSPDQGPTRRRFSKPSILIGHHAACDVAVADPFVSRRHCRIELTTDGVRLLDVGSTNGIFIGDTRVTQVNLPQQGSFRIGRSTVAFRVARDEEQITPTASADMGTLVGASAPMREVFALIERVAPSQATVLITGESGTGKELAARELHARSTRKQGPFLAVNCGAIPSSIIESHLFGHERGSFTGAVERMAGIFEQANGGTVFLDEIGEMDSALQTRLLRVLEERRVRRVGGTEDIALDFRLIAATNRDLREMVKVSTFREDLFFRLHVVTLEMPPLRERPDDIERLAHHFLMQFASEGRNVNFSKEAINALCTHAWPGNVRELRNVIERTLVLTSHDLITPEDLHLIARTCEDEQAGLRRQERLHLLDTLEGCGKNISRAARKLGIARTTLQAKMKRYRITAKS